MQIITITGNTGSVPKKKKVGDGDLEKVTFSVACSAKKWSAEEENYVDKTTWYNVSGVGKRFVNYVHGKNWVMPKGSRVTIVGELSIEEPYFDNNTETYKSSQWINMIEIHVQHSPEGEKPESEKANSKPKEKRPERKRRDYDDVGDEDGLE